MYILSEGLKEDNLEFNTITRRRDMYEFLKKNGFSNAWGYMTSFICYDDKKNNRVFDIYISEKNVRQVEVLRVEFPVTGQSQGLIGNFAGGKAPGRKFSFNSPEDLINKLQKIKL